MASSDFPTTTTPSPHIINLGGRSTKTNTNTNETTMSSILDAKDRTLVALEALLDINKSRTTTQTVAPATSIHNAMSMTMPSRPSFIPAAYQNHQQNHNHALLSMLRMSNTTNNNNNRFVAPPSTLFPSTTANAGINDGTLRRQNNNNQHHQLLHSRMNSSSGSTSSLSSLMNIDNNRKEQAHLLLPRPTSVSSSSSPANSTPPKAGRRKKLMDAANVRKSEVEAALRSKPQRGRKRENLSEEERLELTRTRNREHAKTTRNRKKARYDSLLQIEQEHETCKRQLETMKARRACVDNFLRIRSAHMRCPSSVVAATTTTAAGPASTALFNMNTSSMNSVVSSDHISLASLVQAADNADANKNYGLDDTARSVSFTTDDGVVSDDANNGHHPHHNNVSLKLLQLSASSCFSVDTTLATTFGAVLDDLHSFQFHLCCEFEDGSGEMKFLRFTDLAGMCSFDAIIRDKLLRSNNNNGSGLEMLSKLEYVVSGSPEGEIATISDSAFVQVDLVANIAAENEPVVVASGVMKFLFSSNSDNIVAVDSYIQKNQTAQMVEQAGSTSPHEDDQNGPGMSI